VQRDDGAYQTGEINDEKLVVGVHYKAPSGKRVGKIWEEVEGILEMVGNLMVDG